MGPEQKEWSDLCHALTADGFCRETVVYERLICVQSVLVVEM